MPKSFKEIYNRSNDVDMIIPGIYLGNQESSSDSSFFKKHNITAVINCTPSVPNKFIRSGVKYIRIPVDDSLKVGDINKMTAWLPFVVHQLRQLHKTEKRNVLVHCHAGMQRSAIVVAAYLVQFYNMTPMQAIRFIISKRPIAFMNGQSLNFEKSLQAYYKNKKKFQVKTAPSVKKRRTVRKRVRKVKI